MGEMREQRDQSRTCSGFAESRAKKTEGQMWNLWHGCHKKSEGCQHCYVYRRDAELEKDSNVVSKTSTFNLPIRRDRQGNWKVPSGTLMWTCFTSDFSIEEADEWREDAWLMLRPLDGIHPYRMEGSVELPSGAGENMFGFWKSRLTDVLINTVKSDDGVLVHLATEEYQHLFDWQRVRKEVRIVQPLFYVRKGRDLKMQAVWAKTCRGAMTRFIIEHRITKPDALSAFSYEGFKYDPVLGDTDYPHFIRQ